MHSKKERGQAIVLIALAIVGLVSFTGLAIDGGNAFANQRQAQNAADTAALSTALAAIRDGTPTLGELQTVARNLAAANGYDNNDPNITVTVNWPPDNTSPYSGNTEYIQVIIESQVDTFFAPVVGIDTTTSTVQAVARAKPPETTIPFDGAAVVGVSQQTDDKKQCPIDSGNTDWNITGGGLFANGCAFKKDAGNMNIPNDKCVTSVAGSDGFGDVSCVEENQSDMLYSNDDITAMYPATPACDGTDGIVVNSSNIDSFGNLYENNVFCVSDFDIFEDRHTVLNNATLYVTDTNFNIKFNGDKGSFTGNASTSGTYKGFYLIVEGNLGSCTAYNKGDQLLVLRGNGSATIVGTIFAPSTCLDLRGNSGEDANDSQIIGWKVSSNSSAAEVTVAYNPDNNAKIPVPPQIELSE